MSMDRTVYRWLLLAACFISCIHAGSVDHNLLNSDIKPHNRSESASGLTNFENTTTKDKFLLAGKVTAVKVLREKTEIPTQETITWCSDLGLDFDLDFKSSYNDARGFAHYVSRNLKTELNELYDVYYRDMSPSVTSLNNVFVVVSICTTSDGQTKQDAWLVDLQASLEMFLFQPKYLKVSPDQDKRLENMTAYTVPSGDPKVVDQGNTLRVTPLSITISLVSPDSNGIPLLHLSLQMKNVGVIPLRVFQLVCHNMKGLRDTVVPIPSAFVVQPGGDLVLAINSSIVQTELISSESTPMKLHVVQSSGTMIDIGISALNIKPTKEDSSEEWTESQIDITREDSVLASDTLEGESFGEEVDSNVNEEQVDMWHEQGFENKHTKQLRVRLPSSDQLQSAEILPISTFPSDSWKVTSMALLLAVFGYSSFFVYSRVKNRTITWSKRKKGDYRRGNHSNDGNMDDDVESNESKECEMMIKKFDEPENTQKQEPQEKPEPIQLNHSWGPPSERQTITSKELQNPNRLLPQPMQPVVESNDPYTLNLDKSFRLHPKRFESLWDEYIELKSWQRTSTDKALPLTEVVIALFESQGIMCMASGSVQKMEKYLFYGQEVSSESSFRAISRNRCCVFVEIGVNTLSNETSVNIRGPRDAPNHIIKAYADLIEAILTHLLQVS